MASIEHERRRIRTVVLLYGPASAGKTTAVYALARQLPSGTHGKVAPLSKTEGRLLRLDYRPHDEALVPGYQVSFRLVTAPGGVDEDLIGPLLSEVDAVLLVVDSTLSSIESNVAALGRLDRMVTQDLLVEK